jgi:DNA-binding transcriptional regulator/RsmH inhibitor MraZ
MDENDASESTNVPDAKPQAKFAFFGSYSHTIDAKGRIIIPNAYRGMLGEPFTLGPTRNFNGIALYVSIMDAEKAGEADVDFTNNLNEILEEMGNLRADGNND